MLKLSSVFFVLVFQICCWAVPSWAQGIQQTPGSVYDDARIQQWSKDFLAGRKAELERSVAADLARPDSHVLAAEVWLAVQESLGRSREQAIAAAPEAARARVEAEALIRTLDEQGQPGELLARFPVGKLPPLSPFALFDLAAAAKQMERLDQALAYQLVRLQMYPDSFAGAWDIQDQLAADKREASRKLVQAKIDESELRDSPAAKYLKRILSDDGITDFDKRELVREMWKGRQDYYALRYLANGECDAARPQACAQLLQEAEALYPFLYSTVRIAVAMIKAGKMQEARALLHERAALFAPSGLPASRREMLVLIRVLDEAGEYGEERRELGTALSSFPDELDAHLMMARLEAFSTRHDEAAKQWREVLRIAPRHVEAWAGLARAHRLADDLDGAVEVLGRAKAALPEMTPSLAQETLELLKVRHDDEAISQEGEAALLRFPESTKILHLAGAAQLRLGKIDLAREKFERQLAIAGADKDAVNKLLEIADKNGNAAGDALLAKLQQSYPYSSVLADIEESRLAGRSGSDRSAIVAATEAEIARAPAAWWPYYYRAWEAMQAGDGEGIRNIIARGLAAIPQDSTGRRIELISYRAELMLRMVKGNSARRPSNEVLKQVADDLDQAETLGASRTYIAKWRADLLRMQGDEEGASRQLGLIVRLSPDDGGAIDGLMRAGDEASKKFLWPALHRYVQRNPYKPDRLELALMIHALWGGSPVVALSYARDLKERFPAYWRSSRGPGDEKHAMQQLGAHQLHYREAYDGRDSIAAGERYLGWFDTAREKAQGSTASLLPEKLDLVNMRATIVDADGIEIERAWHPVSGKLTYVRVGRTEMQARYDRDGINLLGLKDSSGMEMKLEYNEEGQIIHMERRRGEDLRIEYGPNDKPVRIVLKGQGEMVVTYGADGEIEKVDSTGGSKLALQVTAAFSNLVGLVKNFSRAQQDFTELPFEDKALEDLLARAEKAKGAAKLKQQLAVAKYLVAHVGDRRDYAADAKQRLEDMFAKAGEDGGKSQEEGLQAIALWHKLADQVYRHGLTEKDMAQWQSMLNWLDSLTGNKKLAAALARLRAGIAHAPFGLLESARWLPRSYIDNPGFWRRYHNARVLPGNASAKDKPAAMLVRRNGDIVVGSARGLSVFRRGFWEWFGYDQNSRRLSQNLESLGGQAAVLSLAEDSAGRLWVGMDNALLRVDGDYEAELTRYASTMQGLPSPRIEQLAAYGDSVLVGTPSGLRAFDANGNSALPEKLKALGANPIRLLRAASNDAQPILLIGTDKSLLALGQGELQPVADYVVQDALYHDGRIYVLRNNEVLYARWQPGARMELKRMIDAGNILFSRSIDGLGEIPLDDGETGLAVLTDQGVSIFHKAHFEHKKLPLADRDGAVQQLASGNGQVVLASSEGIYVLRHPHEAGDMRGKVYDLLTLPEHGATFVARGDVLEAVVHAQAKEGAKPFAYIGATHLARDAQGGLITNDGTTIVRIAPGTTDVVELFSARGRNENGSDKARGIRSLLAASDGSIWVASGASLFHYLAGQVTEFSIYLDEAVFPARSNMISRVFETMDHHIWVIASKEGHLMHRGRYMIGGLLEWDGTGFIRKSDDETLRLPAFVTSYTRVGENRAILGTLSGFGQMEGRGYSWLNEGKDVSYNALSKRQPMLFLGTRGAQFDENSWFFGTAGGIVGWYAGRWIFPDRLNWLLPDQHLSPYGARTVHAVETDAEGRIYAGTDRGLMIYESGGKDFLQFVLSEDLPDVVFSEFEANKLRAESNALLDKLPRDTPAGKLVKAYNDSLAGFASVRGGAQMPESKSKPQGEAGSTAPGKMASGAALAGELDKRERAHKELLAHIEKESRALYQMLELKPLDLVAWRKKLDPDDVVVQYIPTKDRLIIHLASKEQDEIWEVKVGDQELYARSQAVAWVLANQSNQLREVRGAVAVRKGDNLLAAQLATQGEEGLQQELHWLYEQLLRPVESDLQRYKHVYIAPVGALSHLPFAALLRKPGNKPEYAAQRFELGVLPSLYLLDLVLNAGERNSGGAVLFGNPDGTLPGAEREARAIGGIIGGSPTLRIGDEANVKALYDAAPNARWLHMATHGHLNGEDPSQSYLVLANGTRFSMIDAMQLPLEHTETVVLSACESGVGASGLDYATMARAFAYAGATSVVASLWLVNDEATELLMTRFYTHRKEGKNIFLALAQAQRDMIARGGKAATPAAWSGFLAFGRP